MESHKPDNRSGELILKAQTAADLMTTNPISIRREATIREAATCLIDKEITGAPIVDDSGRAIGVISLTDIVRQQAAGDAHEAPDDDYYRQLDRRCPPALRKSVFGGSLESMQVCEVMSPVVIQVATTDSALSVVAQILALKIHRLFVVDETRTLVGVISTLDVLRHLHRADAA